MFFTDYVTPAELRAGQVSQKALRLRFKADAKNFLGDSPLGLSVIEASILVGDTVYELEGALHPKDPAEHTGVFWHENATEKGQMWGGSPAPIPDGIVPLSWPNVVRSLSKLLNKDEASIWHQGVDLRAYWSDYDDKYLCLPPKSKLAKYRLSKLHK